MNWVAAPSAPIDEGFALIDRGVEDQPHASWRGPPDRAAARRSRNLDAIQAMPGGFAITMPAFRDSWRLLHATSARRRPCLDHRACHFRLRSLPVHRRR